MKALLKREIKVLTDISISGRELADLFWEMGQDEQAEFFNRLGSFPQLPMQLQAVTDSTKLEIHGRHGMERIGEYAPND